jgi:hypothetical protein
MQYSETDVKTSHEGTKKTKAQRRDNKAFLKKNIYMSSRPKCSAGRSLQSEGWERSIHVTG